MRSSLVAVPMKYRPPVSFDVSSTVHVVSEAPTPVVRKHPSLRSCSTFSNRGAKTMYIFRQSLIGTTAPSLLSNGCVKSSVTWYFVLLSPLANRRLAPLPALHWNPCPLPTGTPPSVRPCARNTRSRFPSFPYREAEPLARTKVIVMPPVL